MHLGLIVVLVFLATVAFVAARLLEKKNNPTTQVGGATAFAKIADADTKQKEAAGKVLAVKAAAEVKQAEADALKAGALEAHAAVDKAHEALDEVHAILG